MTAPGPGTPAPVVYDQHEYHCQGCRDLARKHTAPDAPYTVCVHEQALGGPFWSCSHCHDDPPPGHICPHCGLAAR